jgi:cyclopropane-fatty-acyl-phospholipid synthase
MAPRRFHRRLQALLEGADVHLDGVRAWDLRIHDQRLPARLLAGGSLALGEAYMDGAWDAEDLDGLLYRLLAAGVDRRVHGLADLRDALLARLSNPQRGRRSFEVGERHYDLGNELYAAMLGRRLVYSCGYWRDAGDLDAAQEAKLDLCCRKLGLRPGMRLLDIGCGWGEMLEYAARHHGVSGVGVTISRQQADYARGLCEGLPVEIRVQDYRELDEPFDRIVSIGMFEHVGVKNYRTYFDVARRCLRDDGLFLLHTIGGNTSRMHQQNVPFQELEVHDRLKHLALHEHADGVHVELVDPVLLEEHGHVVRVDPAHEMLEMEHPLVVDPLRKVARLGLREPVHDLHRHGGHAGAGCPLCDPLVLVLEVAVVSPVPAAVDHNVEVAKEAVGRHLGWTAPRDRRTERRASQGCAALEPRAYAT